MVLLSSGWDRQASSLAQLMAMESSAESKIDAHADMPGAPCLQRRYNDIDGGIGPLQPIRDVRLFLLR